jgi:pyruvate dehydrogenase E1 component alpha subunit
MEITSKQLIEFYTTMVRIRKFETMAAEQFGAGKCPGFVHLYVGEEAVATGVCANLNDNDFITSTHRGHGHMIAKGANVDMMMAELFGKATGYCKGKGGSMHIADVDLGILGANGIVGAGLTIATGAAFGCKYKGTDNVAVCFFGDGASNRGTFHEGLNYAAVFKCPVVFVCENNMYGISNYQKNHQTVTDIADRVAAYGIPGAAVDGNDVVAVYEAVNAAVENARKGGGPSLVECKTWRHRGHFEGDPSTYKDPKEQADWLAKDPIPRLAQKLIEMGAATQAELDAIDARIDAEIAKAVDFADSSPVPDVSELLTDVLA